MGGNFKLVLKVDSLHLFRRVDFSCFIHKNVLKVTSGSSAAASPAAVELLPCAVRCPLIYTEHGFLMCHKTLCVCVCVA